MCRVYRSMYRQLDVSLPVLSEIFVEGVGAAYSTDTPIRIVESFSVIGPELTNNSFTICFRNPPAFLNRTFVIWCRTGGKREFFSLCCNPRIRGHTMCRHIAVATVYDLQLFTRQNSVVNNVTNLKWVTHNHLSTKNRRDCEIENHERRD